MMKATSRICLLGLLIAAIGGTGSTSGNSSWGRTVQHSLPEAGFIVAIPRCGEIEDAIVFDSASKNRICFESSQSTSLVSLEILSSIVSVWPEGGVTKENSELVFPLPSANAL
jgi:hypothetical protein